MSPATRVRSNIKQRYLKYPGIRFKGAGELIQIHRALDSHPFFSPHRVSRQKQSKRSMAQNKNQKNNANKQQQRIKWYQSRSRRRTTGTLCKCLVFGYRCRDIIKE